MYSKGQTDKQNIVYPYTVVTVTRQLAWAKSTQGAGKTVRLDVSVTASLPEMNI